MAEVNNAPTPEERERQLRELNEALRKFTGRSFDMEKNLDMQKLLPKAQDAVANNNGLPMQDLPLTR